jgi:two-component system response regulator TctD
MRILLVEDNRQLSDWLARTLRHDNYAVECSHDGEDALHRLKTQQYDLVILDLGLPGIGGLDVLRKIRSHDSNVPVIILTASTGIEMRIGGLDDGADDYIAKPFDVGELRARIRVLLRREAQHKNPIWHCGNLIFDSNSQQFSIADKTLSITPKEHALLILLMRHAGKTVSKQSLRDSLYTLDDDVSPDAIEIYVHRLRKKLEECSASIVTLRGLGYLLQSQSV